MLFKTIIDENAIEEIAATIHKRTTLIDEIERIVLESEYINTIIGYDNDIIAKININDIECFFIENEKTYAYTSNKMKYLIKKRLYELTNILPNNFFKISKSAIANWNMVAKFRVHINGAVNVIF